MGAESVAILAHDANFYLISFSSIIIINNNNNNNNNISICSVGHTV